MLIRVYTTFILCLVSSGGASVYLVDWNGMHCIVSCALKRLTGDCGGIMMVALNLMELTYTLMSEPLPL